MQIYGLNILDMLLLLILFLGGLVGMLRGIGPLLMSAASIWLALLGSLWTYKLLSINIFQESEIFNVITSDAMAFLIMFVVFFNVIRLLIKYLTTPPEEKKKKVSKKGKVGPVEETPKSATQRFVVGPISALGSIVLGVILTTVWVAIILGVMQFFFQVDPSQATGLAVPGQGLISQIKSSSLVPYFNIVLFGLVKSIDLFVFDKDANILKQVVNLVLP